MTDGTTACSAYIKGCTPGPRSTSLRTLAVGTATTLEPHECAFVFVFGVGGDPDANGVVAFYIVDVNGERVPSLNNLTAFEPGTIFLTSQGGAIAYGRVCNLSAAILAANPAFDGRGHTWDYQLYDNAQLPRRRR